MRKIWTWLGTPDGWMCIGSACLIVGVVAGADLTNSIVIIAAGVIRDDIQKQKERGFA